MILPFRLVREKRGVVSSRSAWVFIDNFGPWLYIEDTLIRLIYTVIKEWRSDRHLVGWWWV